MNFLCLVTSGILLKYLPPSSLPPTFMELSALITGNPEHLLLLMSYISSSLRSRLIYPGTQGRRFTFLTIQDCNSDKLNNFHRHTHRLSLPNSNVNEQISVLKEEGGRGDVNTMEIPYDSTGTKVRIAVRHRMKTIRKMIVHFLHSILLK